MTNPPDRSQDTRRQPSPRLLGHILQTPSGDWRGAMCNQCSARAQANEGLSVVREIRGGGSGGEIEVCNDCGKTIKNTLDQ